MSFVFGIDISSYDAASDWNSVRNQGVRFVIVKASEDTFADSRFVLNWQGAKSVSMYRGAYHFFHSEHDNAAQQAAKFIQTVGSDKGELPPVLDLEPVIINKKDVSPSGATLLARIKAWLDAVESAFGRKPMIYSTSSYLTSHGVNASWVADYPLWLAQYPWMPGTQTQYSDPQNAPTPSATFPQQPSGFQPWTIWQYSSIGVLSAFSSRIDFDYFKGSLSDLAAFAGTTINQPTQPTQPGTTTTTSTSTPTQYTVQAGDTLSGIAAKLNVSLNDLLDANNAALIQPGKVLSVPVKPQQPVSTTPSSSMNTYTVKAGDTLSGIAARFGTTVDAIVAANHISNPNRISVGLVLQIP